MLMVWRAEALAPATGRWCYLSYHSSHPHAGPLVRRYFGIVACPWREDIFGLIGIPAGGLQGSIDVIDVVNVDVKFIQ